MGNELNEQSHEHSGLFPFQSFHDVGTTPLFHVLTRGRGINSEILYHHYPSGDKKVVARYGTLKKKLHWQEAQEMVTDLMQYHEELVKRNVPLPKIEQTKLEYDYSVERTIVIKVTPWSGTEVRHLIQRAHPVHEKHKLEKFVRDMCSILSPVLQDRHQAWETVVGIDPRCSNFTLDEQGKMWFVDLFPPRYRKNGVPLVEWPEPQSEIGRELSHFKHFDVRGILLCTTAQLSRCHPQLKEFFETVVFDEAKKIMSDLEYADFTSELEQSPWMQLRTLLSDQASFDEKAVETAKHIIESAAHKKIFQVKYSVYTLREIALELAQVGALTPQELNNFFALSHFEDELPEPIVQLLQNNLIQFVSRLVK